MEEQRESNVRSRGKRITAGGVSVPIALIVSYIIKETWGHDMPDDVLIALASVIGSLVTVGTLCFNDIRGVLLARMKRRRAEDGR